MKSEFGLKSNGYLFSKMASVETPTDIQLIKCFVWWRDIISSDKVPGLHITDPSLPLKMMMSNDSNNTLYNILHGHDTSLVEWPWQKNNSHRQQRQNKNCSWRHFLCLLLMNINFEKLAHQSIALRPINENLIKVTNTKLLFVATKSLIYRQPMYNN